MLFQTVSWLASRITALTCGTLAQWGLGVRFQAIDACSSNGTRVKHGLCFGASEHPRSSELAHTCGQRRHMARSCEQQLNNPRLGFLATSQHTSFLNQSCSNCTEIVLSHLFPEGTMEQMPSTSQTWLPAALLQTTPPRWDKQSFLQQFNSRSPMNSFKCSSHSCATRGGIVWVSNSTATNPSKTLEVTTSQTTMALQVADNGSEVLGHGLHHPPPCGETLPKLDHFKLSKTSHSKTTMPKRPLPMPLVLAEVTSQAAECAHRHVQYVQWLNPKKMHLQIVCAVTAFWSCFAARLASTLRVKLHTYPWNM